MFFLLPILGLLLAFLANKFARQRRQARLAAEWGCQPPALRQHRWPLGLDNIAGMLKADQTHDVPNYLTQVWKDVGANTWLQYMAGTPIIVTCEPDNIKEILALQFSNFDLPNIRQPIFGAVFGNGIFTDNGKRWEHGRALLRPQFTRDNIADLVAQERHVQNILRHLQPGTDGWSEQTDLSPIFFRLTLDSATEFLFGQSVESQVAALPESEKAEKVAAGDTNLDWIEFGNAFSYAMKCIATKFRLQEFNWVYNTAKYRASAKEVRRFADHFVRRSLAAYQRGEKDVEDGKRKYVFADELVKATQDPTEITNQLLHILLAGRDTTSGMLGWLFYELAENPDIYEKLRSVILHDFGTYDNPRDMDFANLKACSYLQRVMTETLRVFPIVPFNSRIATKDTTLPCGGGPDQRSPIFVAKGTEVNYAVHMMHQRTDLYGPDAAVFNPDRWEKRKSGWEYLPFK